MKPLLTAVLGLLVVACGQAAQPISLPAGGRTSPDRIALGEVTPPTGGTFFDLVAPPLPTGTTSVTLHARLVDARGQTRVLSSIHVTQGTWPGTPVTAGAYTLIYLDENGRDTPFRETVQVRSGRANFIVTGGVWIDPASAAFDSAVSTVTLAYRIGDGSATLKTVRGQLNHVVILPPRTWQWTGLGQATTLRPFSTSAQQSILRKTWGSLFVDRRGSRATSFALRDPSGNTIFTDLADQTEYILPAAPQSEGCYVYQTVTNGLSVRNVSLCSDVQPHQTVRP